MFYIRTDSNPTIATGHLMRCLAIAEALRELGEETTFLIADQNPIPTLQQFGYPYLCLESKWDKLEDELDDLLGLIHNRRISCLLIDSYYATDLYLSEVAKATKVIYIDDLGVVNSDIDLLINYSVYAHTLNYDYILENHRTRLLLGCGYVPLRKEFRQVEANREGEDFRILITSGGTDIYHSSLSLLNMLVNIREFNNTKIHLVVGRYNGDVAELKLMSEANHNIILHENVSYMSELMSECDVAITAGGTTLYELCAVGVPFITYSIADNQFLNVKTFAAYDIAPYAGDIRSNPEEVYQNIKLHLLRFMNDRKMRLDTMSKMKKLVDGMGTARIAKEILSINKDLSANGYNPQDI